MASLLTSNLVAAAGPPLNDPATLPSNATRAPNSSFAAVLTTAVSERSAVPPAEPTTRAADGTEVTLGEDLTAVTESELATTVVAAGFLVQPQLPPVVLPTTAGAGASTQPAAPPISLGEPAPLEPTPLGPAESRTEQLRFQVSPNVPQTGNIEARPDLSAITPDDPPDQPDGSPVPPVVTPPPPQRTVATANVPADAVRAAAVVPPVVAQAPVVVDRGQALPVPPAEVGFGQIRPPVPEPAPVGGLPAAAQTDRSAVRQEFPNIVEAVTANRPQQPPPTPAPFVRVMNDVQQAVITPVDSTGAAAPPAPMSTALPAAAAPGPLETAAEVRTPVSTPANETDPLAPGLPSSTNTATLTAPSSSTTRVDSPPPPTANIPTLSERETPSAEPVPTPSVPFTPPPAPPVSAPRPTDVSQPTAVAVPKFAEEVVTHAQVVSRGGTHEFRLRLDPPELGEVNVRLIASGDRIQAEVLVGDDAVRRMIESQLPDLRQRLEASGLSVSNFDVNTRSGERGQTSAGWERAEAGRPTPPRTPPAVTRWKPAGATTGGTLDVTA
jgi:hypothetical protein